MLSNTHPRRIRLSSTIALTLLLLVPIFSLSHIPIAEAQETPLKKISPSDINTSLMAQHIEYLSSLGSRVTGYPGHYKAAQYIADRLREMGSRLSYRSTVS